MQTGFLVFWYAFILVTCSSIKAESPIDSYLSEPTFPCGQCPPDSYCFAAVSTDPSPSPCNASQCPSSPSQCLLPAATAYSAQDSPLLPTFTQPVPLGFSFINVTLWGQFTCLQGVSQTLNLSLNQCPIGAAVFPPPVIPQCACVGCAMALTWTVPAECLQNPGQLEPIQFELHYTALMFLSAVDMRAVYQGDAADTPDLVTLLPSAVGVAARGAQTIELFFNASLIDSPFQFCVFSAEGAASVLVPAALNDPPNSVSCAVPAITSPGEGLLSFTQNNISASNDLPFYVGCMFCFAFPIHCFPPKKKKLTFFSFHLPHPPFFLSSF